ncbi:MAG TPA: hypothetical protein VKZ63_04130 [Kofleriaceae bacterium]|nr:hypothetical protein [Kofleriaceae bacterium]
MKHSIGLIGALAAALAACGGDDGGDPGADAGALDNPGFARPDVVTTAHSKNGALWEEVGPANWSCLGAPSDDTPSTVAITVTGTVRDFQNEDDTVASAEVEVYAGNDITAAPITTATAGPDGTFTVELPVGSERVAFKAAADEYLDTYLLNQYFEPDTEEQTADLEPISISLANALTAFINKERTLGLGVLAGAIRDCDGNEVSGAIATVSARSGTADHVDGAETYYFSAGGTSSLPVRLTQQSYTNADGLFMAIELPPSSQEVFLQVWGFTPDQDPASDDLTLLAEIGTSVIGDTVISASMEALRE